MADPNQKCVCGFRRFKERRVKTTSSVTRWMRYLDFPVGGHGSAPHGTFFGTGPGTSAWGAFLATHRYTALEVSCESCGRIRRTERLGGLTVMGSYAADGVFYVVAADLFSTGCYSLRVTGPGGAYPAALRLSPFVAPPIHAGTPEETADAPPPGAVAATIQLAAVLPEVTETGDYSIVLVDRCCGCETALATILLEAPPMLIHPHDADLNGAPQLWLHHRVIAPTQQTSGSASGIPFDKCDGVLEYDARLGTMPATQGWALGGTGNLTMHNLQPGGALQIATPGSTTPSYWERALSLDAAGSEIHSYARYLVRVAESENDYGGLDFQALLGVAASAYQGHRYNYRGNQLYRVALDGSSEYAAGPAAPLGWNDYAGSSDFTAPQDEVVNAGILVVTDSGGTTGTAPSTELRACFGDTRGDGITAYVRNFVVSTPGRFVRAWFRAFTPVSAPVLRLYFAAETPGSGGLRARFKVRYGSGSDPYGVPPSEVGGTLNFSTLNAMIALPLSLTGLAANAPMWFTVERDWAHGDDELDATVRLFQATLRAA